MKEERKYLLFNVETEADIKAATIADQAEPLKTPIKPQELLPFEIYKSNIVDIQTAKIKATYQKQETINSHIAKLEAKNFRKDYAMLEADFEKKMQLLAVNPPFAMVKLVILKTNSEMIVLRNRELSRLMELSIIKKVNDYLYSNITGEKGNVTRELVTFNGKWFDIKVLIERGAGLVRIHYRWLEDLCRTGDGFGHYDMIEKRSYQNSPVNKLSLSRNLAVKFGLEFAKINIDYGKCAFNQLEEYSIDSMLKLEHMYRLHCGMKSNFDINLSYSADNYVRYEE